MRRRPSLRSFLLLSLSVTLTACGAQTGSPPREATEAPSSERDFVEVGHVHGLGVRPADRALFVATYHGLFRAAEGETQLQRVGDSRQDTMGFSVVSAKQFIGSGHPDPAVGGPPLLGLISSEDQGRTWTPVSLSGEADFHILRAAGRHIYGFDGASGMLMISGNGGRDWKRRTVPAQVYDLAVDPASAERLVAATDEGLFFSADAGASWSLINPGRSGLLAWRNGSGLVLIAGDGQVFTSTDRGRTLTATGGTIGGPPSAFTAAPAGLLASREDGTVVESTNGGSTWRIRARV